MRRLLSVALVLVLAASSLILVNPAVAVTPSVPEFNLRIVAHPFDVAPVYSINNYTGQRVMIEEGYHVANRSVEVVIKNQPFTTFKDNNGNWYNLYYSFSCKPYLAEVWDYNSGTYPSSGSEYTVLTYYIDDSSKAYFSPMGGKIDFHVLAIIASYTSHVERNPWGGYNVTDISSANSDWSPIQTIEIPIIGSEPPQATSNKTLPPSGTENSGSAGLSWQNMVIAVLAAAVGGLATAVVVLLCKVNAKEK